MTRLTALPSRFHRFVLPALAFKAVVIGGGYATGRELAEFFLPSGPRGGLLGTLVSMVTWSFVCALTFRFAYVTQSTDYQAFFTALLGRFRAIFEIAYFLLVLLVLAVFGAAAGAIGEAMFAWPVIVGTLLLTVLIALFTFYGNRSVEALFKYVSFLLYGTYAAFLVLCLTKFGSRIVASIANHPVTDGSWVVGGITYAAYSAVGAVVILPVTRYFTRPRDAVIAGLTCGPLAMLPAMLMFLCMTAEYPAIAQAALPSDVLLQRLQQPGFHLLFQAMIFAALLESGTGLIHAINERLTHAWTARDAATVPRWVRPCVSVAILLTANFVGVRVGLIDLIARGYRGLAWTFLGIYIVPLFTVGLYRVLRAADTPPYRTKGVVA